MSDEEQTSYLDEITAQIPKADFEAEYFPGGMTRVTMDLTAEMVEQIEAVAEEQSWPRGEALVALLALGLAKFQKERVNALMARNDPPARDSLELLVRRMFRMEMQYAVMKRRTWDFLKAYQTAVMVDSALRTEAAGVKARNAVLRAEVEALQKQVAALQAERDALQQRAMTVEDESGAEMDTLDAARQPWWRRLLRRRNGAR